MVKKVAIAGLISIIAGLVLYGLYGFVRSNQARCNDVRLILSSEQELPFEVQINHDAFARICGSTALAEIFDNDAWVVDRVGKINSIELVITSQPQEYFITTDDAGLVLQSFGYKYITEENKLITYIHTPEVLKANSQMGISLSRAQQVLNYDFLRGLYFFSATSLLFDKSGGSQQKVDEKQRQQDHEYMNVVAAMQKQHEQVFVLKEKNGQ